MMVVEALHAGKNVFVEKPLALNTAELDLIIEAQQSTGKSVMVGFNRRFSPHFRKMKSIVANASMNVIATMNAGMIPANVWVHDMMVGGGRIIGEACHYIDLIIFLTGSKVKSVCMNALGHHPEENTDNASILLKMENGCTGVINYFANGSKAYSKERVEVYSQERTLIMNNFRKTEGYGTKGFSSLKTKIDKGHKQQFQSLIQSIVTGGTPLIPFDEIINTTKASFAAIESLKQGAWVEVE
jgi:predicted dehydrogenase